MRLNRRFTGRAHDPISKRSRGFSVVAALVCLLIVSSLAGSLLKSAVRARRELHAERDRRQAELLVEAGASRAAARLVADPEFRGDTWDLTPAEVIGDGAGRVITEIVAGDQQAGRELRVTAEYPVGRDLSIRRSHTFYLSTAKAQSQE